MTRKVIVHNYWPPQFLTRGLDSATIKAKRKKTKDAKPKQVQYEGYTIWPTVKAGSDVVYYQVNFKSGTKSFATVAEAREAIDRYKARDEDKRWRVSVQMIDPAQLTHHKYAQKFFQTNANSASEAEAKATEFYKKRGYRNIKPVAELIKTTDAGGFPRPWSPWLKDFDRILGIYQGTGLETYENEPHSVALIKQLEKSGKDPKKAFYEDFH